MPDQEMDLQKSITALSTLIADEPALSRKDQLEDKMSKGGLNASEKLELSSLWSGAVADEPLSKSVSARLAATPAGGMVDGSEFLQELITQLDQSLLTLAKSGAVEALRTRNLTKALGNVTIQLADTVDTIVKSQLAICERLNIVETAPQARRSAASAISKSVKRDQTGQQAGGDADLEIDQPAAGLSTKQVGNGLDLLVKSAADNDDSQALERLTIDGQHFESGRFNLMSPQTRTAVNQLAANGAI